MATFILNRNDRIIVPAMGADFEVLNRNLTKSDFVRAGHVPTKAEFHESHQGEEQKISCRATISQKFCHTKKHLDTTIGGRLQPRFTIGCGVKFFDSNSDFDGTAEEMFRKAKRLMQTAGGLDEQFREEILTKLEKKWNENIIWRVKEWVTAHIKTGTACVWKMTSTDVGQKLALFSIAGKRPTEVYEEYGLEEAEKYMRDITDGLAMDACNMTTIQQEATMMCGARADRLYR
jgi:hypothetical protein